VYCYKNTAGLLLTISVPKPDIQRNIPALFQITILKGLTHGVGQQHSQKPTQPWFETVICGPFSAEACVRPQANSNVTRFSPDAYVFPCIIPPMPHAHLHLHVALNRTNERFLGTLEKATLFWKSGSMDRKSFHLASTSHDGKLTATLIQKLYGDPHYVPYSMNSLDRCQNKFYKSLWWFQISKFTSPAETSAYPVASPLLQQTLQPTQ